MCRKKSTSFNLRHYFWIRFVKCIQILIVICYRDRKPLRPQFSFWKMKSVRRCSRKNKKSQDHANIEKCNLKQGNISLEIHINEWIEIEKKLLFSAWKVGMRAVRMPYSFKNRKNYTALWVNATSKQTSSTNNEFFLELVLFSCVRSDIVMFFFDISTVYLIWKQNLNNRKRLEARFCQFFSFFYFLMCDILYIVQVFFFGLNNLFVLRFFQNTTNASEISVYFQNRTVLV